MWWYTSRGSAEARRGRGRLERQSKAPRRERLEPRARQHTFAWWAPLPALVQTQQFGFVAHGGGRPGGLGCRSSIPLSYTACHMRWCAHSISQKACGGGATVELAGFRIISTQNHVDRTTKSVQPTEDHLAEMWRGALVRGAWRCQNDVSSDVRRRETNHSSAPAASAPAAAPAAPAPGRSGGRGA